MPSFRQAQRVARVARDAQHVVLRGLPQSTTAHDVRRMIQKADLKGVANVSLYYKHFRPTGKAILTMSLPDYTPTAIRGAKEIVAPGCEIEAAPVDVPKNMNIPANPSDIEREDAIELSQMGTGPAGRVPERKTVTISGVPGKRSIRDIEYLLKGFRLAQNRKYPVCVVPQPLKKFTLFSRFVIFLESESEAERLVRKVHMTRYKNFDEAPLIRANVIY